MKVNFKWLKENNLILLHAISGSHAYGTSTPNSDIDERFIYILPQDEIYGLNYIEQVSEDKNDVVGYEIGRFIELLLKNNPTVLELLNVPADCLNVRHELMDLIKQEDFISKICANSFGGYATQQIKKARGLNKKIVNPIAKEKKTPIDFCYVIDGYDTIPFSLWLKENNKEQKFCGLVNIGHARDIYAVFYDRIAHNCFSESIPIKKREETKDIIRKTHGTFGSGYKGIEIDNSNTIRVSSIPKDEKAVCIISYNKDGYTSYCKDYHDYWEWDKKKNEDRFKISSEKQYDTKNMMHCFRLTEMAKEIAQGKGVIVRRPNRDFLMKIRNGEMKYEELLDMAESNLKESDKLFKSSSLMNSPDYNKANNLLIEIRRKFYNI